MTIKLDEFYYDNARKFSIILIHKMAIWLTVTLFNVQPDTFLENSKFFELDKISKYIGKLGSKTQEKTCNVNSKTGAALASN